MNVKTGFSVRALSVLFVIALPFVVDAATITMGETSVFSGDDSGNGNLLVAQDTTLSQTATILSMSFNVRTANGNLRLGVYDTTGPGGGPGALKAQTNSFAPVVGWNTANVISPVSLPAGKYWLAYLPSSNGLHFATNFSIGSYRAAIRSFGAMPATFPAIDLSGTTHWSLYATLDVAASPDTTPPTVALTAPTSGTSTRATITVSATATDNSGVLGVQFALDGVNLGAEDTAAPYSISWDTTTASDGAHMLSARARDGAGNVATSSVPVTVDNQAPTITNQNVSSITASTTTVGWTTNEPATSQVMYGPTTTYGAATTLDANLVTSHTQVLGGLQAGTLYHYRISTKDAAGNETLSNDATFTTTGVAPPPPDTTPPTVAITAPAASSSLSGTVVVTADAADNTGVVGVQFLVDGANLGAEDLSAPYSVSWGTTLFANGTHSITARARDAAGNTSTATVSVTVSNIQALPITMGETTRFSGDDSGNGNLLAVQDAVLTQGGQLQSLSLYVNQASGDLRLGVYDATGPNGGPGALKAQTNAFSPIVGWNTAPVIGPAQLQAGNYWLAYLPSSSNLHVATNFSIGSYRAASFPFAAMPLAFPAITQNGTTHWSLYATLTGGSSSDPTPPTVSIAAPTSGATVNDIVTVMADAFDNVAVIGVQFYVDGQVVGVEDTDAPYGVNWDTRSISNGSHTLTARARDAAGNGTLSSSVVVNVANTALFQNEILATGFNLPTNIEFLPDGRMLVVELSGTIKVLPPPYTTPNPTPFLQLNLNIPGYAGVQQGIFDIALDPNFPSNHFYYVFYTKDNPNVDRLSRFTANAALDGTTPGSEVILYQDPQVPNTEHHGGAVNFGNDGKIYFTTGEHFDAANAQDLTNPRGKIHRINPDGTVPTDNPFYDGAGPNWDSIWAYGLRNPFRAYYDAPTGRLLVADVGGNNASTAYEEVDLGIRGANYGWPYCEFGTCGNPSYTAGIYAYPHLGRDAAITGGFVYHGTQFPASFQGSYFYADYTQNWIKRLTFDAQGNVNGTFNFEPPDGSADGPYGDIVYLAEGPEGALYYVDLGYSDVGGTFGISKIRRIRYVSSNLPPTSIASANPTQGPVPLAVTFSSATSSDPEGRPLTYLWTFGDGATSTEANPVHTYTSAGKYTARLTTSDGVSSTLSTPVIISAGAPPVATILSPQDGSFFIAGDVIAYSGDGTDVDDGPLPASAFTWDIDFLHETHVHPGVHAVGLKSGTFVIPTSGHDFSGNTRYRFTLTVTDSNGLTDVKSVIIWPKKVNLTFDTLPSGLTLYLDGIAQPTPLVYDTLTNFQHSIEARNQSTTTTTYTFASWSDGGAQTHTIVVPASAQRYTATYTVTPNTTPITMGETTVFSGDDFGNGNLLVVQDVVLAQPGTIRSLSLYAPQASGSLRLGVYDTTGPGGGPGTLKAQTDAFTPVVGWNTVNVATPVSLAAGNYWLAYLASSNSLHYATNFSIGSYRAANVAFGAMPATFPPVAFSGTTHWSLYGTLTP